MRRTDGGRGDEKVATVGEFTACGGVVGKMVE